MLDPSYSPETLSGQKCIPAALEAFCEPMISNPRLSAHTSGGRPMSDACSEVCSGVALIRAAELRRKLPKAHFFDHAKIGFSELTVPIDIDAPKHAACDRQRLHF